MYLLSRVTTVCMYVYVAFQMIIEPNVCVCTKEI